MVSLAFALTACDPESSTFVQTEQNDVELRLLLNLPEHMPLPAIPELNPISAEKIELGRFLFYDKNLSANQTQSCASCHNAQLAFADGLETPTGSTGHPLIRNSQGLTNVAFNATFTWSNNGFLELEDQLNVPIRADDPIELGVTDGQVDTVLARFSRDPDYQQRFADAFPESDSDISINKIIFALASFVRSLNSANSAYDDFLNGDSNALTEQQKMGLRLFNGEKFECFHCHTGINFTVSYRDKNTGSNLTFPFFNNGLYNVGGNGDYPASDQGLYDLTSKPSDKGLFRPPSLRNIALTAPYMHDGSIANLRDVIKHYARGGRLITAGENAGDGRLNPNKSVLIQGFEASDEEIDALIAFLESLTDYDFINNPKFSDPFKD